MPNPNSGSNEHAVVISSSTDKGSQQQQHHHHQQHHQYYYYYLSSIILIWFILCVGVVLKHHSLIDIFYSFVICSILAVVMMSMMMRYFSIHQSPIGTTINDDCSTTINKINTKNMKNTTMTTTIIITMIRATIGILACSLQIYLILLQQAILQRKGNDHNLSSSLLSSLVSTYKIVAGYLVFDQWYTFYMIRRFLSNRETLDDENTNNNNVNKFRQPLLQPPQCVSSNCNCNKSIYSAMEDAITLIVFLIVLVQPPPDEYRTTEQFQLQIEQGNNVVGYHRHVYYCLIWPMYKLIRLFLTLILSAIPATNNNNDDNNKKEYQIRLATTTPLQQNNNSSKNDMTATKSEQVPKFNSVSDKHDNASISQQLRPANDIATVMTTPSPSPKQAIWRIYNIEYDVTDFVRDHPGGYEAIMLGCNRNDCTALFRSYHPSPVSYKKATKVLQSYRIKSNNDNNNNSGVDPTATTCPTSTEAPTLQKPVVRNGSDMNHHPNSQHSTIETNTRTDDKFYDLLCERVTKELWDRHQFHIVKDRTATPTRVTYYIFVTIGVLVSAYNYGVRGRSIFYGSIPFAIFGWLFGALGHDAGHYTVCRTHPIVNDICVWAMALLCNPIVWQHQHTYGHHSHTNDVSHDPDLHHFTTFLRVHEKFQYYNIYRYQKHPLYVFFAYTFVVFGTCIWIPLGLIQEGSLYGIVEWTDRHRPWRTIGMYIHLIAYTIFIVVVPFFVCTHWYMAWLSVTTHISLSGIIFAIFSQINHINEPSLRRAVNDTNANENDNEQLSKLSKDAAQIVQTSWAAQQIVSSNNFCPQSSLWYYVSNGLNVQIEHHLFPGVNHCHLYKIQPIVRDICHEYGIQYKCYENWYDIMKATLAWLDQLSDFSQRVGVVSGKKSL